MFRTCIVRALKHGQVEVMGISKPACRESHSSMKRVYRGRLHAIQQEVA